MWFPGQQKISGHFAQVFQYILDLANVAGLASGFNMIYLTEAK